VVVTPERAVLDEATDFVVLPMIDGELGVLPKHAPLVGRLGPGELRLGMGANARRYFVDGGFAQILANVVTVLTDRAVPAAQIDGQSAATAVRTAEAIQATTPAERLNKQRAIARAQAQVRIAQKSV
jgi:F-type H+-transporting ATPase subunit epsilon